MLIAVRLEKFLYPFMAWFTFNKRQADRYINFTWNLKRVFVYFILNFSLKYKDFTHH